MNSFRSFFKNLFFQTPKSVVLEELRGVQLTDAIFQNLVIAKRVPGMAVSIVKKNELLLQKGYGYANLEHKIPVDPKRTIFRIASISKCITGLSLGKMMEQGLMDLDASFYDYVPYYPKKEFDFTIRQLASHTAGIRGYRGKEFALNVPNSIKDSIDFFKDDPLVFEPGKGYLYTSFDFVLLSLAMQEVCQMPFETYVKEQVLDPLGMKSTFPPSKKGDISAMENVSHFYSKSSSGFREAIPVSNFYKIAGGGYLSTCEDISNMGKAILKGELLGGTTYKEILTTQMVNGKPTYYGLGFQVSEDFRGKKFVGHVGNNVGAYTNLFIYPEEEVVVSILINATDPKVQPELDKAIDAIFDLPTS